MLAAPANADPVARRAHVAAAAQMLFPGAVPIVDMEALWTVTWLIPVPVIVRARIVAAVATATAVCIALILGVLSVKLIESPFVEVNAALAVVARFVTAVAITGADSCAVEGAWSAHLFGPNRCRAGGKE